MSRSEPRKKTGRTPQTYGTACTETQRPEESGIPWEDKSLRIEGRKLERNVDLLGDGVRKKTGQDGEHPRRPNRRLCMDLKLH